LKKLLKEFDLSPLRWLIAHREVAVILKHLNIIHRKVKGGVVLPEISNHCPTLRLYSPLISLCEEARSLLVSSPDEVFIECDYNSQELAIIALLSGEDSLVEALRKGIDVHELTARRIFSTEKPTPRQREVGKAINYSLLYGSTQGGIEWKLGITRDQAKELIESWKSTYPNVTAWLDEQRKLIQKNGFVESAFGLRSFVDENVGSDGYSYQREVRRLINAQVQSIGAYMLKASLRRAHEAGLNIILPRHDAILVSTNKNVTERTIQMLREAMAFEWRGFTFNVEVKTSTNFGFINPPAGAYRATKFG